MDNNLKYRDKGKKNYRRTNKSQNLKFVERLIKVSRVTKVTKGGKKLSPIQDSGIRLSLRRSASQFPDSWNHL